jgi:hypothetical protein
MLEGKSRKFNGLLLLLLDRNVLEAALEADLDTRDVRGPIRELVTQKREKLNKAMIGASSSMLQREPRHSVSVHNEEKRINTTTGTMQMIDCYVRLDPPAAMKDVNWNRESGPHRKFGIRRVTARATGTKSAIERK